MDYTKYISLERLTSQLGLPRGYLSELAEQKKIPSLSVGGRLKFNPSAVQSALEKLAEQSDGGGSHA